MKCHLADSDLERAIGVGRAHLQDAGLGWSLPWYSILDRLVLAIAFQTRDEEPLVAGTDDVRFTLMSVVKPFILLRQLQRMGLAAVSALVDNEPSTMAFYSAEQLAADNGRPRNAMLNSGAMLLADRFFEGEPAEQAEAFVEWLNGLAGCRLAICEDSLHELMSTLDESSVNWVLAQMLAQAGHTSDPQRMIDIYFRLCCIAGDIRDAARLARVLAFPHPDIDAGHLEHVRSAMRVGGLYEDSQDWAQRWNMPTKSGVSGIVIATIPEVGGLAAYSPWLQPGGNSGGAMRMIAHLLEELCH